MVTAFFHWSSAFLLICVAMEDLRCSILIVKPAPFTFSFLSFPFYPICLHFLSFVSILPNLFIFSFFYCHFTQFVYLFLLMLPFYPICLPFSYFVPILLNLFQFVPILPNLFTFPIFRFHRMFFSPEVVNLLWRHKGVISVGGK